MRERPILFSGAMVRAILEGRKTMTRQVVCPACLRENYSLRPPHWAEIGEGRAA